MTGKKELLIKEEVAEKLREGLKGFIGKPNTLIIQRAIFIKIEEIFKDMQQRYAISWYGE
jgi:hypothetical protein